MKAKELPRNIKLSPNFYLHEFFVSEKYPDLAENIEVTIEDVVSLTYLANTVLQPVRSLMKISWVVNSGKRDSTLNKAVGGSRTSQHVFAEAGDIDLNGDVAWEAFELMFSMYKARIGQAIIYLDNDMIPYFIHFSAPSLRGSTKKEKDFRVHYNGGFYKYETSKFFRKSREK